MRPVLGQIVVAALLALAGVVSWRMGNGEQQIAAAHEQLATLRYSVAAEPGEIDRALGYLTRIPGADGGMADDARGVRATADYWLAKYDALKASNAPGASDPRLLFLAANAAYRATQDETVDRAVALSHLDSVVKDYGEAMKRDPGNADAAYNYEFVVRMRDELARQKGAAGVSKLSVAESTPTIHGRPGAPPKGVSMSQFKVMVPKRSDERKDSQDAGKGETKPRKG